MTNLQNIFDTIVGWDGAAYDGWKTAKLEDLAVQAYELGEHGDGYKQITELDALRIAIAILAYRYVDNSHDGYLIRQSLETGAAALGAKGGKAKSAAKKASAVENGKKGGRPRQVHLWDIAGKKPVPITIESALSALESNYAKGSTADFLKIVIAENAENALKTKRTYCYTELRAAFLRGCNNAAEIRRFCVEKGMHGWLGVLREHGSIGPAFCGSWQTVVNAMNDEIREQLHNEMAPCTNAEFISRYLAQDPNFKLN